MIIFDETGCEIDRESVYLGCMTNNMAEHEALVLALKRASKSSVKNLYIYTDSLLVANQIAGKYRIKNLALLKYVESAKIIIEYFSSFTLKYVPTEKNRLTDKLSQEAVNKKGVDG